MRYLMLIRHSEDIRNLPFPKVLMDAMDPFIGDAMKQGVIVDTAGRKPTAESARVRSWRVFRSRPNQGSSGVLLTTGMSMNVALPAAR